MLTTHDRQGAKWRPSPGLPATMECGIRADRVPSNLTKVLPVTSVQSCELRTDDVAMLSCSRVAHAE